MMFELGFEDCVVYHVKEENGESFSGRKYRLNQDSEGQEVERKKTKGRNKRIVGVKSSGL